MSRHKKTMVVVDDDRLFCDTVQHALADLNLTVAVAHTAADGLELCSGMSADVVLLDQNLPDGSGIDLCEPILQYHEGVKIIFITAFPSFENAVQAIKAGAHDYLSKPFEMGELRLTVSQTLRTLALERMEQVHRFHCNRERDRTVLVGAESGLSDVQRMVDLAAGNRAPVLITGETGTGKTLVAKTIHFRGQAAKDTFIAVNCAAIPENLMEAQLFGYEKGAFTGAVDAAKGFFEMADEGTLFLDEIAEIPLHLQSKLLGVLDDHEIRRLGGQTLKAVNVRIVAATNADIAAAVGERRFREDLFYRLSVVQIHIPPLRERLEDIPELCRFFIAHIAPDHEIHLDKDQIAAMQAYPWPGNVRELRNIIERAILVRIGPHIQPAALLGRPVPESPPPAAGFPKGTSIAPLQEVEKNHIQNALIYFDGNHTRTAGALGISRSTLIRKMKTFGIKSTHSH